MTPAATISALDRATVVAGEDVVLRRLVGTEQAPVDVGCRVCVPDYKPADLVGKIDQNPFTVILSPTEMQRTWLWPPIVGDRLIKDGRTHRVLDVMQRKIGNELVRIELRVMG